MISIGIGTGSFFLKRRLISLPINNRTMHVNPTINAAILVVVIFESTAAMLCNKPEVSQLFLRKYNLYRDLPQKSKLDTAVQLWFYSVFITTMNQCLTKIPIVSTKHRSSQYLMLLMHLQSFTVIVFLKWGKIWRKHYHGGKVYTKPHLLSSRFSHIFHTGNYVKAINANSF